MPRLSAVPTGVMPNRAFPLLSVVPRAQPSPHILTILAFNGSDANGRYTLPSTLCVLLHVLMQMVARREDERQRLTLLRRTVVGLGADQIG